MNPPPRDYQQKEHVGPRTKQKLSKATILEADGGFYYRTIPYDLKYCVLRSRSIVLSFVTLVREGKANYLCPAHPL
jgi:hypothetical protein